MPEVVEHNLSKTHPSNVFYPASTEEKEIVYPEQREDDMGETSIHIRVVANFLSILKLFLKHQEDVFITANMNLYYEKGNPNKWYAPDILIAFGVPNHERSSYKIWDEKVSPHVIFEVSSERTWKADISEKLEIYSQLGVEEYYILDPEFKYLPAPILAFELQGERLLTVPVNNDRIFSPRLGLEIVRTENSFRLFDPNKNEFLRTLDESESEIERLKAEIEKLKSDR